MSLISSGHPATIVSVSVHRSESNLLDCPLELQFLLWGDMDMVRSLCQVATSGSIRGEYLDSTSAISISFPGRYLIVTS